MTAPSRATCSTDTATDRVRHCTHARHWQVAVCGWPIKVPWSALGRREPPPHLLCVVCAEMMDACPQCVAKP